MNRPTLPQPKRKPLPQRPTPRPAPQEPRRPLPPKPKRFFAVETYDNGWWHAVDERGVEVRKEGMVGIFFEMTGVSAKRVRERMRDEMPDWEEGAGADAH